MRSASYFLAFPADSEGVIAGEGTHVPEQAGKPELILETFRPSGATGTNGVLGNAKMGAAVCNDTLEASAGAGLNIDHRYSVEPISSISMNNAVDHVFGCGCICCIPRDEPSELSQITHVVNSTGATAPTGRLQVMADYLREGFWLDSVTVTRKYNLSATGVNPNSGVLEYNLAGFTDKLGYTDLDGISEARKFLVRESFKIFEEVLGIDFVETTNANADFFFSDNANGAFAAAQGVSSGVEYSVINVAASWSGGTSSYDDYALQTILHEIGHALGLGHQGPYNGSGGFNDSAIYANDSWQNSIMSYFSQTENTTISADFEFLQTPMAVDWLALDDIYSGDSFGSQFYGVQNAFTGDTVYGFNTNITSAASDIWANYANYGFRTAYTIVDASGIDTLDVSGYGADQRIDLTLTDPNAIAPTVLNIGGRLGNLTLAIGMVIENAKGGAGNDVFIGNLADNEFWGNGGNDVFSDSNGNDTYRGGDGVDTVNFSARFVDYSFDLVGDFLEVVANASSSVIDFVENTVEWLGFNDDTLSFNSIVEGLSPPPPPPSEDYFDFSAAVISDFQPGVQDFGDYVLSPDGLALSQESQSWEQILGTFSIDADSRLRFDFSAEVEGEVHGIMFTNGETISEATALQFLGTQAWGLQAHNDYVSGSGVKSYDIPIGAYFTGDFDRLVFLTDDDALAGADSTWANVELLV